MESLYRNKIIRPKIEQHISTKKRNLRFSFGICAIFRNEAEYLKEWVEFHILMGCEIFYLYNNLSEDNYADVLAPYIRRGIVVLHDVKFSHPQMDVYNHCLSSVRGDVKWLAVIDIDEFVYASKPGDLLLDVLNDYENYPAVAVQTVLFGSSGRIFKPEGLVIENFTRHGVVKNNLVKLVVRPERTFRFFNPHQATFIYNKNAVDESGVELLDCPTIRQEAISRIRINHYWSKSIEEFLRTKVPRGLADQKHKKFRSRDPVSVIESDRKNNAIEDFSIGRHLPALRSRMSAVAGSTE